MPATVPFNFTEYINSSFNNQRESQPKVIHKQGIFSAKTTGDWNEMDLQAPRYND